MFKRVVVMALGLVLAGAAGVFLWARSVLTQDAVRTAIAVRLTQALGQPVAIGAISASLSPRLTVGLERVSIGQPPRITVEKLGIGTNLRALISRRIEHGSMRLRGARIELPLPRFGTAESETTPAREREPGVDLVSIDDIALTDVQVISGGRTLRGDVEIALGGREITVKKIALGADRMAITIAGVVTDLTGPTGELTLKASSLDLDQLAAFAADFSRGLQTNSPATGSARSTASDSMNLSVGLEAGKATMGPIVLEKLSGRARLTSRQLDLEPVGFGLFGGRCAASVAWAVAGSPPQLRLRATLSGIDMADVMRLAGSPNTVTGSLAGALDLSGRGTETASLLKGVRGTARIDITNGVVRNLGLIQAVVVATSMRSGTPAPPGGSRDEPFTRLGGTLEISNGQATTQNLRFESKDLALSASGTMRLDGSAISLRGQVQLSDALSQQAGRDLLRYTQEQGRVTLPATITGSVERPTVRLDVGDLAMRAARNRAQEEARKAVAKGLGRLLGRR